MYACEVIHFIQKRVTSPYVQECGILLKFNNLRLHYVHIIALELNASLFKAALNTRSTLYVIWQNNLETFKKLFLCYNHVAVFTVISWNHYTVIFTNFGTKRLLPPIRAAEIVECVRIRTESHKIYKAWVLINQILPWCFCSYGLWLRV